MTTEKLNAAIQLIQSGHRQSAVPVLREIIQENPSNEHAWLWLYACVDQVEQKKLCLQNVLKINPANQQAREALAAFTAPASVASADGIERREERVENREEKVESREESSEWQRTEPEQAEREETEPERAERERTKPEKVEQEEAQAAQAPLQMDWDEMDDAEPVSAPSPKPGMVKARPRSARRRKARSKRLACFPILAGAVLFLMLFTVCFVFMEQMGLFTALRSLLPLVTPTP